MQLLRIAVLSTCVWGAALNLGAQEQDKPQTVDAKPIAPRAAPTDYQGQAKAGEFTLAADFVGHAVPTPDLMLNDEDYVVVEAAVFGPPNSHLALAFGDFSLRINGKKSPLPSQSWVILGKSLKDPEWVAPETIAAAKAKSGGGSGLSTGGGGQESSLPVIIHVPVPLQRGWNQRAEKASLPEGDRPLPQAGLLFFSYRGRVQSIHSVELIYSGPAGKATLTLTP